MRNFFLKDSEFFLVCVSAGQSTADAKNGVRIYAEMIRRIQETDRLEAFLVVRMRFNLPTSLPLLG